MTPYYETDLGRLYHGDCFDIMKQCKDNEFDLVLTDPPYGIGICKTGVVGGDKLVKATDFGKCAWDFKTPNKIYFDRMLKISKQQIIFGGNYFIEYLHNSPCWLVWDKDNGNNDFADCELAWTSFDSAVRKITFRWQGMLQQNMKAKEKRYHPTQKPVGLFVRILQKYANENDLILDPFMGSGTTAIACERLNKRWIGIEKEEKYCKVTKERLEKEVEQFKLF